MDISQQALKENTMGELPYGKEPKPFKGFAWKQVPKKGEKKPKLFKQNVESTKGELPHGQKPKLFMENVESSKGKEKYEKYEKYGKPKKVPFIFLPLGMTKEKLESEKADFYRRWKVVQHTPIPKARRGVSEPSN